jgi:hypothetical protein
LFFGSREPYAVIAGPGKFPCHDMDDMDDMDEKMIWMKRDAGRSGVG